MIAGRAERNMEIQDWANEKIIRKLPDRQAGRSFPSKAPRCGYADSRSLQNVLAALYVCT